MPIQYFTFEQLPDYEVVMVDSIEGNPSFQEIGIFEDSACVGAQVMEGYPIQILVYPNTQDKDQIPYEFRLFDGEKSEYKYSYVMDGDNSQNEFPTLLYPSPRDFRSIILIREGDIPPTRIALRQNYPNPFNPETTIEFAIPRIVEVSLNIYNVRGQLVKELVNDGYQPGRYKVIWDGKNSNGKLCASGVYLYRLKVGNKSLTRKMMMIK